MHSGVHIFAQFELDLANRRLLRKGETVELNARYLDALALMVGEPGQLITKDRFHDEVWRGIPVTDEALTQCIRTLRRALGDDASNPRFIETVPKHGYRFIAPVAAGASPANESHPVREASGASKPLQLTPEFRRTVSAGTLGGAAAGLIGGLFYGLVAVARPEMGSASVLLVLLVGTTLIAAVGAAGVTLGIAALTMLAGDGWRWSLLGGALGGIIVGGFFNLVGMDAYALLTGNAPPPITGAGEGALLGGAVGLALWLALRNGPASALRRQIAIAAPIGALAGAAIVVLGGRLLGGSLRAVAATFPASRLRLDFPGTSALGAEALEIVTAALEGMLFASAIVGAIALVRRHSRAARPEIVAPQI